MECEAFGCTWSYGGFQRNLLIEVSKRFRVLLRTLLDLCISFLRRGHATLLCIVPILSDDFVELRVQGLGCLEVLGSYGSLIK